MGSNMYVQYGCGWNAPQDWRNFDASPTLYFERMPLVGKLYTKNKTRFPHNVEFGDIVEGLPISDGSCRVFIVLTFLSICHWMISVRRLGIHGAFSKLAACFALFCPIWNLRFKDMLAPNHRKQPLISLEKQGWEENPETGI